jgi:hypothetical protein
VGGKNYKSSYFEEGFLPFFSYDLGGLKEFKFINVFILGVGGGIGGGVFFGMEPFSYPYIKGSASILSENNVKAGLYYDYCFDFGSRFGLRIYFKTN